MVIFSKQGIVGDTHFVKHRGGDVKLIAGLLVDLCLLVKQATESGCLLLMVPNLRIDSVEGVVIHR